MKYKNLSISQDSGENMILAMSYMLVVIFFLKFELGTCALPTNCTVTRSKFPHLTHDPFRSHVSYQEENRLIINGVWGFESKRRVF